MTTRRTMSDRLDRLPRWAQDYINQQAQRNDELRRRCQNLEESVIEVLQYRSWVSLWPGGLPEEQCQPSGLRSLFFLDKDDAARLAALMPGDVVIIGRKREEPWKKP